MEAAAVMGAAPTNWDHAVAEQVAGDASATDAAREL